MSSLVALPVSSVSVIATYPRECVSLRESHRGWTDHLTSWAAILGNGYLAHCLHFPHEVALMLGFMATVPKAAIYATAYPSRCPSPSLAHSLLGASWDCLPNKRLAPKSLFTVRQREGMMQGYIRIVTRTPRVRRRCSEASSVAQEGGGLSQTGSVGPDSQTVSASASKYRPFHYQSLRCLQSIRGHCPRTRGKLQEGEVCPPWLLSLKRVLGHS